MAEDKEYKTGYSTTVSIPIMNKIEETQKKLNISKSEVGRKIFEFFYEHNDIEDLQA